MDLKNLLRDTRAAGERLDEARTDASVGAVGILREIEKRLKDALGEDTIRGMADLVPGSDPRCYAAQLAEKKYGIDTELPAESREALCVDKKGNLVMMHRGVGSDWTKWASRPLADDEVRAEHLEPAVRAIQQVLERHLLRTERATKNYEAVASLSEKLAAAIGFKL